MGVLNLKVERGNIVSNAAADGFASWVLDFF